MRSLEETPHSAPRSGSRPLPAEQRISEITGRLADVRRELAAPIFQGSPQARDLTEQIEAFSTDTVTADLHSLTG